MKKIIPFILLMAACQKSNTQEELPGTGFEKTPLAAVITRGNIKEASGIADSRALPGHLWVEQDSGNPPLIYLLKHDGSVTDSVMLEGVTNRDWEDMVIGKGPDDARNYLYVAETGDNEARYTDYSIYRFIEPSAGEHTVTAVDKINFTYPDGAHDAEAILVDNGTKDIYIITKRDASSKIYKLTYPYSTTTMNQAVFVTDLSFTGVVSATVSADGREVVIKTYTQLFYYSSVSGEALSETLVRTPSKLDYQVEAQGEAICFAEDGSGFFTLSEEAMGVMPKLNFYKRK